MTCGRPLGKTGTALHEKDDVECILPTCSLSSLHFHEQLALFQLLQVSLVFDIQHLTRNYVHPYDQCTSIAGKHGDVHIVLAIQRSAVAAV